MIEIKHARTGATLLRVDRESLQGADLHGASLEYALLDGASLEGADLRGTMLRGANLRGANLSRAQLQAVILTDADLGGATLNGAFLQEATLKGTHLEGAHLEGIRMPGAVLIRARLAGASLRQVDLRRADLRDADLCGARLAHVDLAAARLRDVLLRGASLFAVDLKDAELYGYTDEGTWRFPLPGLAGATYDEDTRWPAGFDPEEHGAVRWDKPAAVPRARALAVSPKQLAARNLDSWRRLAALWQEGCERRGGEAPRPLLRLVKAIAASDRARLFRAGQSLNTLIISTKEYHGLEEGDSSIHVWVDEEGECNAIYFKAGQIPGREQFQCPESEIMLRLTPMMDRLYAHTRGEPAGRPAVDTPPGSG